MLQFPGNSDIDAWIKACVRHNDVMTAKVVIDAAKQEGTLLPAHLDVAAASKLSGSTAALLVAAGVRSDAAAFCVATEAAVAAVATTGVDWNVRDADGNTPLHAAAQHNVDAATCAALLAVVDGTLRNALNKQSRTALAEAVIANHLGPAEALLAAGVDVPSPGLAATPAMAKLLLQHVVPGPQDCAILKQRRRDFKIARVKLPDALDKKAVAAERARKAEAHAQAKANFDEIADMLWGAAKRSAELEAVLAQFD